MQFKEAVSDYDANSAAYAEWVKVDPPLMEAAAYVDPNTIRRKGDVVKMWYLFDYNTARSDLRGSYLSQKAQAQFDCAEERIRVLASIIKCRLHPASWLD